MKRTLACGAAAALTLLTGLAAVPHGIAGARAAAPVRPWHEEADHMGSGLAARSAARTSGPAVGALDFE